MLPDSSQRPDQALVQAALRDPEELAPLVERYEAPLMRYVQRLGGVDADTAKDVVQETFIKVYIYLNDYDSRLAFSSWVYRIAHNEAMRHFRRQKNRPHAFVSDKAASLFETIPDELNLERETDKAITVAQLAELLLLLKPLYRDVLILRFYEEKDYAEISDILEMPMGTVATNLSRAKTALKELLTKRDIMNI